MVLSAILLTSHNKGGTEMVRGVSAIAFSVLVFGCCHRMPSAGDVLGRADGFLQIAKTSTWLRQRGMKEATESDVRSLLGAEAAYSRKLPVQIGREWTNDLLWEDSTQRYSIFFERTAAGAHVPFSIFRFIGQFASRADALGAVGAWMGILDPETETKMSPALEVQPLDAYDARDLTIDGRHVHVSAALVQGAGSWVAKLDVASTETK